MLVRVDEGDLVIRKLGTSVRAVLGERQSFWKEAVNRRLCQRRVLQETLSHTAPQLFYLPVAAHGVVTRLRTALFSNFRGLIKLCDQAMPTIGARLVKWTPFLLLCSPPTLAQPTNETTVANSTPETSVSPSSTQTKSSSSTPSPHRSSAASYDSTCGFRTINYITHTLPQQCLRTSWSAPTPAASAEGLEGAGLALPTLWAGIPWIADDVAGNISASGQLSASVTVDSATETATTDTAAASGTTSTEAEAEIETDSPLDNANFLSFEDWKKKNLARAGQSPENVGQGRAASSDSKPRRRPVNINALDALGEESEIDIDFGGFGNVADGETGTANTPSSSVDATEGIKVADDGDKVAPTAFARSKDAGKTCKERFNYASFDCAATVLKTNSKAKSTSAVLVENKDSYMLNECSVENKFVIVELCDDILVDTVVIANYEFFSSMFRHFRVSVSDRYPVKMDRWRTLATFEARNSRDIQPFLIAEPQIWARYLRIEFLTHYGNEFYCPLSLLRVHGTTMMEQFRREEEEARGDDDYVEPIESADGDPVKTAAVIENNNGAIPSEYVHIEPDKSADLEPEAPLPTKTEDTSDAERSAEASTQVTNINSQSGEPVPTQSPKAGSPTNATTAQSSTETAPEKNETSSTAASQTETTNSAPLTDTSRGEQSNNPTSSQSSSTKPISSSNPSSSSSKQAATTTKSPPQDGKPTTNETSSVPSASQTVKVASNATASGSQTQTQPRAPSQAQPNPAAPTTQESFFKSIHKRLQQLEANSTLSLQYIEEQSRILRDAFIKVEKRQLQKTEKFLTHLNDTVMHELKSYRNMYDQLWQSTILELEGMKERQRSEIGEIGARLSLVADELVWQKRMAVVQSTLLLLCLGLVLFVRSGTLSAQSDMPIVQQIGNKYSHFFESPPHSPEDSSVIRRRRTFRNMWRSDTSVGLSSGHLSDGAHLGSDADTDGGRSPVQIEFSPPTPNTLDATSDVGSSPAQPSGGTSISGNSPGPTPTLNGGPVTGLDDTRRIEVLATQSGPATPRGSRDSRPSWEEVDRAMDMLKAEQQVQNNSPSRSRRRNKHSPLRRTESYEAADDSPGDDSGDGLFVVG